MEERLEEHLKEPGFLLKKICELKDREANLSLESIGLTVSQSRILGFLYHREEHCCTMKELERTFSVAQSTVAGTVSRMERKGMVRGCPDEKDRRVKWVCLTEKGLERCKICQEQIDQSDARMLACFSEEESRELMRLLMKLYRSLREQERSGG